MKPSKRELWREVEQLKEEQQGQGLVNLLREDTETNRDGDTDRETIEELQEMADNLF